MMRLPLFFLDLDYSELHIKVHVSQIKKFLPLDKKYGLNMGSGSKNRLDQEKLKKLNEESPARRNSITRVANSVVEALKRSSSKMRESESEYGDKDSVNNDAISLNNAPNEKRSL